MLENTPLKKHTHIYFPKKNAKLEKPSQMEVAGKDGPVLSAFKSVGTFFRNPNY